MTKLLLLGGTSDGRYLAEQLFSQGINVIYSVAGIVRSPNLECETVSGGFSQFGGLGKYIQENKVAAVLNATHPYAEKMSQAAVEACKEQGIPCWRFLRPCWEAQEGDQWQEFSTWEELLPALKDKCSIFFNVGQLEQSFMDELIASATVPQKYVLRTAMTPKITMPDSMKWIKAIGPFQLENELAILREHNIDVMVSKNSGGDSTAAKLEAARECAVPVYMLARKAIAPADETFADLEACAAFVLQQNDFKRETSNAL